MCATWEGECEGKIAVEASARRGPHLGSVVLEGAGALAKVQLGVLGLCLAHNDEQHVLLVLKRPPRNVVVQQRRAAQPRHNLPQ